MLRRIPLKRSTKPLKRTPLKKGGKPKSEEEIIYKKLEAEKMRTFFYLCFQTLPRQSEIGPNYEKFYGELSSINYHHCFEKNDNAYPELKYSISNILRVTAQEHQCLNSDLEHFPEAREKRKYIRDNWEEIKKESIEFEEMFAKLKNNV